MKGHEVAVAENGRVALEALEKQAPDLVLMDIQLPEMDGFQATAAIREGELKRGKHMPIIAVTAHTIVAGGQRTVPWGRHGRLRLEAAPSRGTFSCYHKSTFASSKELRKSGAFAIFRNAVNSSLRFLCFF